MAQTRPGQLALLVLSIPFGQQEQAAMAAESGQGLCHAVEQHDGILCHRLSDLPHGIRNLSLDGSAVALAQTLVADDQAAGELLRCVTHLGDALPLHCIRGTLCFLSRETLSHHQFHKSSDALLVVDVVLPQRIVSVNDERRFHFPFFGIVSNLKIGSLQFSDSP